MMIYFFYKFSHNILIYLIGDAENCKLKDHVVYKTIQKLSIFYGETMIYVIRHVMNKFNKNNIFI